MSIGQAKKLGNANFRWHWGPSLLTLLLMAAAAIFATIFGLGIGIIILGGPIICGGWYVLYNGIHNKKMNYLDMLHPIKTNFGEVALGWLIKEAFIGGVAAIASGLTAVFGGIAVLTPVFGVIMITIVWIIATIAMVIMSLYLALVEYIMMREDNVKGWDAVKRSKRYMTGNTGRLFGFELSFIGWILLTCIFFPVAIYTMPYYYTSKLYFLGSIYDDGITADKQAAYYQTNYTQPSDIPEGAVNFAQVNWNADENGNPDVTACLNNLCGRLK